MSSKASTSQTRARARPIGDKVVLGVLAFFSLMVGVLVVLVYHLGAGINAPMKMLPQMRPVDLGTPPPRVASAAPPAANAVAAKRPELTPASSAAMKAKAPARPTGSVIVKRRNAAAMPEAPVAKASERFIVPLESFVVAMGGGGSHFLKLTLSVEVGLEAVQAEIMAKQAEIRTVLVAHFSGISPETTKGVGGKQRLRTEAAEQIESVLKSGKVNRVFISEIVSR